ncbi:Pex24p-domain-containing protein [Patellaria atrata CBS 101060]|uniref:Pex24p-domain-containing protein n=1 Tax=Patellaria atrata CBS 101060 TaxID=1346257 RepID=A0A9P4SJ50_9PEZI|nr:Pex24p-domain-containing protein [Patellaria atrata CBS 101060]
MEKSPAHTLVNRDDPIPTISVSSSQYESTSPARNEPSSSKRESFRRNLSPNNLKGKLEDLKHDEMLGPKGSMQDRLFNMLLQQIVPVQESDEPGETPMDKRSRKYVDRPNFSLPLMSSNFRRFNSRIGVAFIFQNRMIRLFTWRAPTQTLSFLAIYTFLCLEPTLLAVLPLVGCLFFVMVPAYLARHPAPPTTLPTEAYPLTGPAIAPPPTVKPAPELSKDFFRNMRDLQNCMEDFSRLHDLAISVIAPPTNFSNESLSSTLFLSIFFLSCALFIVSHLLPWRGIFLILGWIAVCVGHSSVQELLHTPKANKLYHDNETKVTSWFDDFSTSDNLLSTRFEKREVEIFELQRHDLYSKDSEYEPFMFSSSPYTPLSPSRIAGDRPRGTRFFEDVEPPSGWRWSDKKWILDLLSREWVEERCISGVEIEIEGERWVTDIKYDDEKELGTRPSFNSKGKSKDSEARKSWEEGNGSGQKGEWRRRRWVRLVERRPLTESGLS